MLDKVNLDGDVCKMIKPCGPDDIDAVIRMGYRWADQWSIDDYDEEIWRQNVRQYSILNQLRCLVWYDGMMRPAGFLLGSASAAPHSGEITAQIHYIYLGDEFLEFINIKELTSEFESWARECGATSILTPGAYQVHGTYRQAFDDLGYDTTVAVRTKGVE